MVQRSLDGFGSLHLSDKPQLIGKLHKDKSHLTTAVGCTTHELPFTCFHLPQPDNGHFGLHFQTPMKDDTKRWFVLIGISFFLFCLLS